MNASLKGLDLNLLLVLEALLAERSVGRAAVRLELSQPAVSNALSRLRKALGDPLFVRVARGVAPTDRALALEEPLRAALGTLREALEPAPAFDPAVARHTFVLAASDHAQLLVVPPLAEQLGRWPGLTLRVVPLPRAFPTTELERGELDLVLGVFDVAPGDRAPSGLKRQLLVEEQMVAVGRKGHPALRGDPRRAAHLPQLNVAPLGGTNNPRDRRGTPQLRRNIVLFVPHYLVAPWVLSSTDLLAVLPERLAARFCEVFPLQKVGLGPAPTLKVQQLWHPRVHAHPAHRWLRAEVLAAARGYPPNTSSDLASAPARPSNSAIASVRRPRSIAKTR